MKTWPVLLLSLLVPGAAAAAPADQSPAFWRDQGEEALRSALARQPITGRARNVILFVGDGNGVTTVTATRIFDGQSRGGRGEENRLAYEDFPYLALAKTYNTNQQTPDSAGTMTAIMTGVKTRAGVISMGPAARRADCAGSRGRELPTLLETAEQRGMNTAIVTNTRVTHATPAATYAHTPERDWEDDSLMPADARKHCADIARQLVEFGHGDGIDLVLGGGRRHFLPVGEPDPEYPRRTGRRRDGRNLVAEWQSRYPEGRFIWNREQFDTLDPAASGPVLGLFSPSHMAFEADREQAGAAEPSLSAMVGGALDLLAARDRGYFLMVEGGRIDHAHHYGNAHRALVEGQEFSRAVQVALDRVDLRETLVIVTADHSHVFTMAGYPTRGNAILGKVVGNDEHGEPRRQPTLADDGLPFTTLGYANGYGFGHGDDIHQRLRRGGSTGRRDLSGIDVTDKNFYQEALVPLRRGERAETHGGEDVAVYAAGPWAHLVHGVREQNYLYYVIRHALDPAP